MAWEIKMNVLYELALRGLLTVTRWNRAVQVFLDGGAGVELRGIMHEEYYSYEN